MVKKIITAKHRGFCAGVERAVEMVEKSLIKYGAPVYVRHEIVHNKFVVNNLREKGVVFVDSLEEIPKNTKQPVIFSAHGVAQRVINKAKDYNLLFYDAICPLVSKIHKEIIQLENNEYKIIMIGHEHHPEVDGTAGQLKDISNLTLVQDLASKLNAAIGGTRAIVDAGWMPYSQQVGQTGKTVKPDVYIALGISGATQHQVGMKDSKYIIAVNKVEESPIFKIDDLGLVGDTLSIVPKFT